MKMLNKLRIVLAATVLALASISVAGSASAGFGGFGGIPIWFYGSGFMY
jgi:hypothetical protein